MRAYVRLPALAVLLLGVGACQHLGPGKPAQRAAAGAAPDPSALVLTAEPRASIRSPEPTRALVSSEPLPLPDAPMLHPGGLRGIPRSSVRRPASGPAEQVPLPEPVALAAAPGVGPSYSLIERYLWEPRRERIGDGGETTGTPSTFRTTAEAETGRKSKASPEAAFPPGAPPAAVPSTVVPSAAPASGAALKADPPAAARSALEEPSSSPLGGARVFDGSPTPRAARPAAGAAAPSPRVPVLPGDSTGSPLPTASGAQEVRERHREVLARRGDPIELSFEGEGWLFASAGTGRGAKAEAVDGLDFEGSSSERGRSRFGFVARRLGEYLLSFQLQDHKSGILRNEVVRLRVLGDEEFSRELEVGAGSVDSSEAAAVAAGSSFRPQAQRLAEPPAAGVLRRSGEPTGAPGPPVPTADRWFDLGEFDLALEEYLKAYRPGDPYLNERIAASYAATGQYLAATKYYARNLNAPGDYLELAAAGLVRCGLALEDDGLLADAVPALLSVESLPIRRELLGLARFHMDRGRAALAMTLLQESLRRYAGGPGLDEVLFRMAQLYESESPLRDLEAARDTYERVYDEWPESPFSEPAHERLRYLERHFFDVR